MTKIIIKGNLLPQKKMHLLLDEVEQLLRIIAKSIITAKGNRKKKDPRE